MYLELRKMLLSTCFL